jgi:hypothetical protein
MAVTLVKLSDFRVNDVVTDYEWNADGDMGMILDTPNPANDYRWEIYWDCGTYTYERLPAMLGFSHLVKA